MRSLLPFWLFVVVTATVGSPASAASAPANVGIAPDSAALDVDTFRFTVEPAHLIVGESPQATITIEARDDSGAPLDVALPRLSTSTGTIEAPVRTGPGVFRARFVPPAESFPHVALVSATMDTADATSVGFVTVPLWGRGQTTVKTKPGSKVTVFVGADAFGPIVADGDGDARVSILVPPGPEHAVAKSVDAVGNESQKTIDLGVPAFNRLALFPLDDIVSGDGNGRARLLVFVVDKKGAPLVSAGLTSTVAVGVVDGAPKALAPGMFELQWTPGVQKQQQVPITVALDGALVSKAVTTVRVIGGHPARADVTTPQQSLGADEGRELLVRVTVFDQGGNPVPFGAARVDVDVGRIGGVTGGEASKQIAWVLPAKLPGSADTSVPAAGQRTATLRVRAGNGVVLGEARVILLPGKPHTLKLAPFDDVTADGSAAAPIIVTAQDAAGNDVVPAGVVVTGSGGKVVAANVDATARRFRALFVPEPRDEEEVTEIEARLGSISTTSLLRLRPRPRALLLVGPALTSSWSYGAVTAVGPELSMLVRLPLFDGAVHAGLTLGVLEGLPSSSSSKFQQHRAFPVFGEVAWRPLLLPDLGLHLGLAGGLVASDVVVARAGGGEARQIEPAVGGAVVVGVAYRVGPGFFELDAKGGYAVVVGDSLIDGAPFGAGVSLGYRFGI